jgi:surface antigen
MFFSSTATNQTVFAVDSFYSGNDILFYDGAATICSSGSASLYLSGTDNSQKIYNFWISKGLTPAQSAGIVGNIKNESGYSPFRQQEGSVWPEGGYGIAQFTGSQREKVTKYLADELGNNFNQYYSNNHGGPVTEENSFIPKSIKPEINDAFLLGQLNYLAEYTSGFIPSTIPVRVSGLANDYGITIQPGVKLLDFMKTLTSAGDAAKAWIYLYEQPSEITSKAAERAAVADEILDKYSNGNSNIGDCTVGVGGLNFDQAKIFMEYYYNNRSEYLAGTTFQNAGMSNQCTAFSYYFNKRFIRDSSGAGNGKDVVNNLVASFPDYYQSTNTSNLQPFSIFSLVNDGYGHTGVILGIESDGSVIIGEANSDPSALKESVGLLEKEVIGTSLDQVKGVVSAERWKDIKSWVNAMENSWNLTDPTFASPVNANETTDKVQAAL